MLAQAKLPLIFWWNAFHTAAYLINRLPTPVLKNQSHYFKIFQQQPYYNMLRVFGCSCFPYLRPYNKHKLEFRIGRCIFIGYSSHHKGYQCLHSSGRVYVSNHVVFNKQSFLYQSGVDFFSVQESCSSESFFTSQSRDVISHYMIQPLSAPSIVSNPSVHLPSQVTATFSSYIDPSDHSSTSPHSQSTSSNHRHNSSQHSSPPHNLPPSQPLGHPMITKSKVDIFKPKTYLVALLSAPTEPIYVKQALAYPKWFHAMKEEFNSLQANKTWTLVQPSSPVKVIGNKWVFRIKYNPDGSISKYKARLVAKDFAQTQGVDYNETFSLVVKASTIRIILSLVVMQGWIIRQVDVDNAFLKGFLEKDVYISQLEGFIDASKPHHVCKLTKALYGLKHAPRAWSDRFKTTIVY